MVSCEKRNFLVYGTFCQANGDRAEQKTETRSAIRCLREDLIGMDQVKEQVMETVQVMKFNRLRKEMGMKKSSYHNVHMMLGAPGTAKTTVAKLNGKDHGRRKTSAWKSIHLRKRC